MNTFWNEFVSTIRDGYRNWNVYSARSSRKEFWLWAVHAWIVISAISLLNNDTLSFLILIPLVPSIAMWVRRIHDTGHRIWWCFIPAIGGIINFVLLVSKTDPQETRWVRPEQRILNVK
jgi:uncharacterized membrane protein YhaH (DUF805 family)